MCVVHIQDVVRKRERRDDRGDDRMFLLSMCLVDLRRLSLYLAYLIL